MPSSRGSILPATSASCHREGSLKDLFGKANPFGKKSNHSSGGSSHHHKRLNKNKGDSSHLIPRSSSTSTGSHGALKPKSKPIGRRSSSKTKSKISKISASRIVDTTTIMENLNCIKNHPYITQVEIGDLVMSDHQSLFPLVKGLACSRSFERFEFVDALELSQFQAWQELRDGMMQEYEQTSYEHHSQLIDSMVWQASVRLSRGTSVEDVLDFLVLLQEDLDVFGVSFSKGSAGESSVLPSEFPQELCKLVDDDTWDLTDSIVVRVTCGWGDDEDWLPLLQECVYRLSALCGLDQSSDCPGNTKKQSERELEELRYTASTRSCSLSVDSDDNDGAKRSSRFNWSEHSAQENERSLKSLHHWTNGSCHGSTKSFNASSFAGYSSFYEASWGNLGASQLGLDVESSSEQEDSEATPQATTTMPQAA